MVYDWGLKLQSVFFTFVKHTCSPILGGSVIENTLVASETMQINKKGYMAPHHNHILYF